MLFEPLNLEYIINFIKDDTIPLQIRQILLINLKDFVKKLEV